MPISATGQAAWGISPVSPNFLSLLILLIRYKKRNFRGKPLPGGSLLTGTYSSSHHPLLYSAPSKKYRRG